MGNPKSRRGFLTRMAALPLATLLPSAGASSGYTVMGRNIIETMSVSRGVAGLQEAVGSVIDLNQDFTLEAWVMPISGTLMHTRLSELSPSKDVGGKWLHVAVVGKKEENPEEEVRGYFNGVEEPQGVDLATDIINQAYKQYAMSDTNDIQFSMIDSIRFTACVRDPDSTLVHTGPV